MFGGDRDLDTICAISTPPGVGGVHLIRISGSAALALTRKSAPFLPPEVDSHRIYFGTMIWGGDLRDPIDEVLVSYFRAGRSFTGEETIEISCHGSPFVASRIVKALLHHGARMADRGEFTYRAFLSGKLDLVQAESVLSLIEAESQKSSEIALKQLKGGLSSELRTIENSILALLARLEISIDFTAEDVEIISSAEIKQRVSLINRPIQKLLSSFRTGSRIHSGFEVVLVGEPNVGKSSLLNRILAEERAIVTDIAGTTRDLIHEDITIKGVKVKLIDSAGIRETNDVIEKMGVDRTREVLGRADLVLALFDCSNPRLEHLLAELPDSAKNIFFIGNKADLIESTTKAHICQDLLKLLQQMNKFQNKALDATFAEEHCTFVSTLEESSRSLIMDLLEHNLDTGSFGDEAVLSHARHFENLQRSAECLERAAVLALEHASPELLAIEVKEALVRVQETLGERFDDQVLDRVFSEFCIGK